MTEVWVTSLGTEFVETDFSVKSISQGHRAYDAKRYFATKFIQFLKIMTHKRLMVFFRFIGVPDLKNFLSEVDHGNPALGSVECVTSYIEKTKPNHTREFFLFLFSLALGNNKKYDKHMIWFAVTNAIALPKMQNKFQNICSDCSG